MSFCRPSNGVEISPSRLVYKHFVPPPLCFESRAEQPRIDAASARADGDEVKQQVCIGAAIKNVQFRGGGSNPPVVDRHGRGLCIAWPMGSRRQGRYAREGRVERDEEHTRVRLLH